MNTRKLFILVLLLMPASIMAAKNSVTNRQLDGSAMKTVWPVTDRSVMRSLNGEWRFDEEGF